MAHDRTSSDVDPQNMILWELYGHRWLIPRFKALGSVEKTLGDFFKEGSASACCVAFFILSNANFFAAADIHLFHGPTEIAVLKISGQLKSTENVMIDVVPMIEKPSEISKLLDHSYLQKVLNVTKTMIDTLAEVGDII